MATKDDFTDSKGSEEWSPDPRNPDLKVVTGFTMGRSEDDSLYRLYLTKDFSHYLEFSKKDTAHAQKTSDHKTTVWLQPATQVREIHSKTVPVEFLQGDLQRGAFRGLSSFNLGGVMMMTDCPRSGCGHCTASCSSLPGGPPDTAGFTCNC